MRELMQQVWVSCLSAGLVLVTAMGAKGETGADGVPYRTNAELRALSVFAEAEDFTLPQGWSVAGGHGIDMYSPAVSGGKTVHNACEGTAALEVTIPKEGVYFLWMWVTKWVHDRNLELRVEQDGKVVAASTFNRPQDKFANWSYNMQCGEATAALKAGPARLVIYGPKFGGYVGSPVDCVLLTQAALKTPDWHDFSPQCFVRFTILTPEAPAVTAAISSSWHHTPWWSSAPALGDEAGKPVPPGTPSAWTDISKALDTGQSQATIWFAFKGAAPMPPVWRLRLEIATRPALGAILKTLEEEWDGDAAGYVMPGNVGKYPDQVESVATITDRHLALVQGLTLPGGHRDLRPKQLSIEGDAYSRSPRLFAKESIVLARMGINSVKLYGKAYQDAAAAGSMDLSKAATQHFIHDIGLTACSFDPALRARLEKTLTDWVENMKKTDPVQFQKVRYVILADEPGTPNGLTHRANCSFCQEAFRKWLEARGETPQHFEAESWDQIKPVMTDPKASVERRRLGWLSSVFAQETTPFPFKNATEVLQRAFGRPIGTRVNFSDECMSGYSTTMSDGNNLNWFEFGRMAATTIPWTEDFISWNPHITPFLVDVLRSTSTTRDLPLGMYIIWGFGPPKDPNSAALRTMTAVARGVKTINHYWYGPYYASTECAFSEDERYVKSVAYVNRVLGLADDLLGKAVAPTRSVAILWSQATEQWKPDDAFTVERRMLHHALSMQQIPADFICEKDLPTRLKEYKVLYLPANNLPRDCAEAVAAWVKAGGTVVVCGGGPERDEINEPFNALWPTLGLAGVERRKDALNYRGETLGLAHLKGTTEVTRLTGQPPIAVSGYKAVITPTSSATVLGTYKEGGAAIVENRVGKGRALTFGFNPGISLLIAMDAASCPSFWNVFPENELRIIAAPVFESGVLPPVTTRAGVDAARLDAPLGSVVTLANFTLAPIAKLSVQVRGVPKARRVVSSVRGPVAFKRTKAGIAVELPLDTVDVVKLYR